MKKAVIYARYSSERQTEQSIEGQLRVCHEFAEHENITVVKEYIDRAISGTTDHRPEFQRMISDCSTSGVDYVIVYKLDRFARNRYDSAIYKAKLKQYGIRLLSAMEKITDSPEGIIMEGLLEAMNEYYSAELSQKIRRGMRENVIKGKTTGGNVALGYRIGADKKIEINREQAAVVRKIFDMYAGGCTFADIIKELNDSGYKTSRGNSFNKNSVSRILSNERYIGRYTIKGIDEVAECPRIVSDEIFKKVQERLGSARQKRRERSRHTYLLSGVLHCGECGGRMVGTSGTSKTGKHYYYYKCHNKHYGRIDAVKLECAILKTIDDYLQSDKMATIAKVAYDEYCRQIRDNSELKTVQSELKRVETKLKNAVDAILSGIQSESIKSAIAELEVQKSSLASRLDVLKSEAPQLTLEMFETAVKCFADSPSAALIDSVIKKIEFYGDYIIVHFRLFDIDPEGDSDRFYPEAVRIEYNVSSPPNPFANSLKKLGMPFPIICPTLEMVCLGLRNFSLFFRLNQCEIPTET